MFVIVSPCAVNTPVLFPSYLSRNSALTWLHVSGDRDRISLLKHLREFQCDLRGRMKMIERLAAVGKDLGYSGNT